jgi:hypothetical protein
MEQNKQAVEGFLKMADWAMREAKWNITDAKFYAQASEISRQLENLKIAYKNSK